MVSTSKIVFVAAALAVLAVAQVHASGPPAGCFYQGFVLQLSDLNYQVGGGYSGIHKGPSSTGVLNYFYGPGPEIKFTVDQGAGLITLLNDVELNVKERNNEFGTDTVSIVWKSGSTLSFNPSSNKHPGQKVKDINGRWSHSLFHTGGDLAFDVKRNGVVLESSSVNFLAQRWGSTDFNSVAFHDIQDTANGKHTATVSLWGTELSVAAGGKNSWKHVIPGQNNPLATDMVFSGNYVCDGTTPSGEEEECPVPGTETATYRLRNHPDGNAGGDYGLRLDDWVQGVDPMTFNFNTNGADMRMTVNIDPNTGAPGDVRVFGRAMANEAAANFAWYVIDFTYKGVFRKGSNNAFLVGPDHPETGGHIWLESDPDNKRTLEEVSMGAAWHLETGHRCGGSKPCPADQWVMWGWIDETGVRVDTRDFLALVTDCIDDSTTPSGEEEEEEEECTLHNVDENCKCVANGAHSNGKKCVTLCFNPDGTPRINCDSYDYNMD